MTIKDIARESGYAVGTVSRALNNAPGVSAETRQKILEIVNRHNYEPNANAKHLKQQANDGIALIVKGTQNMLFAGILEPLSRSLRKAATLRRSTILTRKPTRLRRLDASAQSANPMVYCFSAQIRNTSRRSWRHWVSPACC